MTMIAEKATSSRERDLEERYEIMVTSEHRADDFRNISAEESLQQAPVFELNNTERNTLSEIPTTYSDEEIVQEVEHENGNLLNDEGEEDLNEGQNNRAEGEADGDEDYFFPSPEEVEEARPPEVGMVFATLKDAHRFVNAYGQVVGFVVVKGRNYKQRKITLQCNKSRKTKENDTRQGKRKRNIIERTGCRMKVTVKNVEGRWQIMTIINEHNHPLWSSPSLTKFFISHKYMTEEERNFSRVLQESKIKPAKIMEIFRNLRGRFKNIPVRKMDVNNHEQSDRVMNTYNTNVETTLACVRRLQKEHPGFYYALKTDEGSAVRSIFWTDARARLDYTLYGDLISFDTDYTTIDSNMSFVPLVGIDGHCKTIVFGWALLEDAKAETFSWLFRTLLDVMDGKKPSVIMTPQDSSLQESIAEVFPTVFHRFSMWHVMREAASEVGGFMVNKPGMEDELTHLVTNSLTTEEFEDGWKAMLQKYGAVSNAHLKLMYQRRLSWAPVYFKHVFCPFVRGKSTNSIFEEDVLRGKSTNSVFKADVLREDTVENFIHLYETFQKGVVFIEDSDRFESTLKRPMYCTMQPIERHAGEVYTTGLFMKFQKELLHASAFNVSEEEKGIFTVKKALDYEGAEFVRDSFTVEVDLKTNTFNCICSKFERDGILCCHILRLFTQFGVNEIPEHYIKGRWTKKFREHELQKFFAENTGSDVSQNALRYAMLMNRMSESCATVSKDPNQSKMFLEEHERILQKLTGRE